MTTSDPPVQVQAYWPERDACIVTGGPQSGPAAEPEQDARQAHYEMLPSRGWSPVDAAWSAHAPAPGPTPEPKLDGKWGRASG